eukprot:40413-Eustigmatos_ZCMA.PRE.1
MSCRRSTVNRHVRTPPLSDACSRSTVTHPFLSLIRPFTYSAWRRHLELPTYKSRVQETRQR